MNGLPNIGIKQTNLIAWLLVGLLILSAILVLWVTNSIRHNVIEIHNKWEELGEISAHKLHIVDKIHAEMGFGGLIHLYSDLIIRGGRLNIEDIHEKIGGVETELQEYAAEDLNPTEQRAIIDIRSVLDTYREKLRLADNLLQSGIATIATDDRLYVDDRAAIAALELLYREAIAEADIDSAGMGYGVQVNELRHVLGYGGLIHFFKYYILTKDEKHREAAKEKLFEARKILERLRAFELGSDESLAIGILLNGLANYSETLDKISQMIGQGRSIHEVDVSTYVDDVPALSALDILRKSVRTYNKDQSNQVGMSLQNIMDMTSTTVWTVIVLSIIILCAFYWLLNVELLSIFSREKQSLEDELNTILESIPIGVGIAKKETGYVEYSNSRGAELFGYLAKEDFIGKSFLTVWADDRQRLEYYNTFNQLGYVPEREIQLLKSNGYPFWTLLGWEPIQYHDEEHVLFWYHDISERKKMQEELMRSEQQLRTILESAPVGVGISRKADGLLSFCNTQAIKMFGFSHKDITQTTVKGLWVDQSQRDEFLQILKTEGEVREREVELKRTDGTHFWALLGWKSIMVQGAEQILFWVYDYDELKQTSLALEQAREEADRANESKSTFFSNMSHELRTPMNSVIGFAQMMENDPREPLTPKQEKCVHHIIKAGKHLLGLINEILDLSKIEACRIDFSIEAVSVREVLNECLDLIAPLIQQHGIGVVRFDESAGGDCYVKADYVRLKQVLINLLSNAVKYNAEQKQVGVGCWATSDGMLRIFVADTGIGISDNRIDELFTLYRRLDAGASGIEGSGLGLSITRKLIEEMGGRVGVESQPDRGSVFWFELPLADDAA